MAPLTRNQNAVRREGDLRGGPVAATQEIFIGAMVMRQADGTITNGAVAVGSVGCGVAENRVDNSGGISGDRTVQYRVGTFRIGNAAGPDNIVAADIGALCYIIDNQTVGKTDGSGTRSPAGFVEDVDRGGVWVRFDEIVTRLG